MINESPEEQPFEEASGLQVYTDQRARQGRYTGKVLGGRFLLKERIGEGAEGVIYRAHERYDISRVYAVKVNFAPMRDRLCSDGLPADPILREAKVLESISGPWFPKIESAGWTSAGHSYLVRELVNGISLAEVLQKRQPFPVKSAAFVLDQLCQAVRALHENDITHRDIKPGNLLLVQPKGENPSLRMVDFGATTSLSCEPFSTDPEEIASGTPAYTAPERVQGHPGGILADYYSICAIGYELLTATAPLGKVSRDMREAKRYLLSDKPIPTNSLSTIRSDLPSFFSETVTKGLMRNPAERGGGISILKAALIPHLPRHFDEIQWLFGSHLTPENSAHMLGHTPLPNSDENDKTTLLEKFLKPFNKEE